MRRKNNTVIAILIISLLFITGCGGSKIALSKEAKEVIKKYNIPAPDLRVHCSDHHKAAERAQ